MGVQVMLKVLCTARARLRQTVQQRRMVTRMSFKTEAIQSVGGSDKATANVPFCHHPSRQERRYHQPPASTLPEMARTNVMKRRDEYLESGQIQRSLPRVSGRSTTSRITHIVHGAGIADEAEVLRDHTEVGQRLTRSSARDECPPSVWTIASSARKTWAQMVRQSRRWRLHFLLCTMQIRRPFTAYP